MNERDEKAAHGLSVIGGMMGAEFAQGLREYSTAGSLGSDIARMAIDYSFADSWGREGLPLREKSLVVIGILIALGQPSELRNHVKIGVANGLTAADFDAILVQASTYVGLPAIATASTAVIEALREADMVRDARTSEEQGLL